MKRDLEGKVVVLTGGGRGIGASTTKLLTSAGATMAICDLDEASIRESGVFGRVVDVTDRAAFKAFLDEVEAELGPVDVLINNAGIMPLNRIEDETDRATHDIIGLNLMAVIYATKEMVTRMKKRGTGGQIINVSSAAGRIPIAGASTYVASKHAVSGFSNSLHIEFKADKTPIQISVVHPAMVHTELATGFRANKGPAKPVTPELVAEGILSAIRKPRPNIYVPRSLGPSVRSGALIPRRTGEWLNKVLGGERAALDALDDPQRKAYEERAAKSAPAVDKEFRD
ncbi:SDR family oxidoreductase [Aeromicrobium panaciterrae]|uniref:SDR family NAD(P)-dependent oxidoreductase n=1 Tax=Aeromicrobium panaciterrae TaxID=363861 RepID=UPI0031D50ADC